METRRLATESVRRMDGMAGGRPRSAGLFTINDARGRRATPSAVAAVPPTSRDPHAMTIGGGGTTAVSG